MSFVHFIEKLIFLGGISGTPQLGIVLEDHQDSLDEGSGMRQYQKKIFSIDYMVVEMVRLESDESDNYTPHTNTSLLTADYVIEPIR